MTPAGLLIALAGLRIVCGRPKAGVEKSMPANSRHSDTGNLPYAIAKANMAETIPQ